MDFSDQLHALANRIPKQKDHLKTEAATSTALVLPFINALGYNVFDPTEVVPEFTADSGIKKGEKVDYAIKQGDQITMLVEVKCWDVDLNESHSSQLYRYFSVTNAKFAILTNGIQSKFFTDLEEQNKMDDKPFFEFNMLDLKAEVISTLKQFTKTHFDLNSLICSASELKYTRGIIRELTAEYASPSDELIRILAKRVFSGILTAKAREQFADIVKRSFHQFVNDKLNERLKSALDEGEGNRRCALDTCVEEPPADLPEGVVAIDGDIVTTQDEVDGFNIVKAIMTEVMTPERIVLRDTKSYCGILLDDNNRKPICRLHFNRKQKYLGVFNCDRKEEKIPIESLTEIYKHAAKLKEAISLYNNEEENA